MKVRGHVANSEVGMCVVKGFLSAYDNELKVASLIELLFLIRIKFFLIK